MPILLQHVVLACISMFGTVLAAAIAALIGRSIRKDVNGRISQLVDEAYRRGVAEGRLTERRRPRS